jgi:hypothetical protein
MSEPILIRVLDVIGRPLAVDTADGQRVHDKIAPLLIEGKKIVLSFDGITMVITAFLNTAIGQLYGDKKLSEGKVDSHLEVKGLLPVFQSTLEKSRELSKAYFKDPERFKKAIQEVMGNEEQGN